MLRRVHETRLLQKEHVAHEQNAQWVSEKEASQKLEHCCVDEPSSIGSQVESDMEARVAACARPLP